VKIDVRSCGFFRYLTFKVRVNIYVVDDGWRRRRRTMMRMAVADDEVSGSGR